MNAISQALRDVVGLFVDDGALAFSIIVVVVAAAIVAAVLPGTVGAGLVLVVG
jgi:hypothetical protein